MYELPSWAEHASNGLLWANVAVFAGLLLVFGLTEPWRRSWFGWAIVLLTIGILQLSIRALFTLFLGEDYPGRDLVLLFGRLELVVSGIALLIGLVIQKRLHPRPTP